MAGDEDAPADESTDSGPRQYDSRKQRNSDATVDGASSSEESGLITVDLPAVSEAESKLTRTVAGDSKDESIGQDGEFSDDLFLPSTPQIERYRIDRQLATGGFGNVYLATDTELKRPVAIKIPHQARMAKSFDVERFLEEARVIASLDHPGVVPIYDFGKIHDRYFIVSKFIDGHTLTDWMSESHTGIEKLHVLRALASTLQFIHSQDVVHRDIKPANVLMDGLGRCYLTDFGLALHLNDAPRRTGKIGTYAYMSPEQARGESHLVDNRSDLFSLGVVMYEMLCGERPFVDEETHRLLESIKNTTPIPLREHDRRIPKELERICLRLLCKRATMRYHDAGALVDDLDWVLSQGESDEAWKSESRIVLGSHRDALSAEMSKSSDALTEIVPRGFRAFDEEDADYFIRLLPGPFDRMGMPESIRFWKRRIESHDFETAFRIGVIYGKSGSGKSSFVRAGLLPRLSESIVVCFVSASASDTDRLIVSTLRHAVPALPETVNVTEAMSWIRQHAEQLPGGKLLLVIDQFEQWLHSHAGRTDTALALALRQCDGENLQCILLVRDDYWIGVSCLADELEVDLVRSQNLAMLDLFDQRHARRVLAEYGRGYERLPDQLTKLNAEQSRFLDEAIAGLAVEGKIAPVQLVTFAEIMKSRPWTMKSLQQIGGVDGVGLKFLDESFGASAPVQRQVHLEAVEKVLASLMPDPGSPLKGASRGEAELRQISGYGANPRQFASLLAILDGELHLITPSDSKLDIPGENQQYQLTHDYLVPAIRSWLTRNLRSSMQGRAQLILSGYAEIWNARKENRHLPSWSEWIRIMSLTKRSRWSENERRMMRLTTRKHIGETLKVAAVLLVAAVLIGAWMIRSRSIAICERLLTADPSRAVTILQDIENYPRWSLPRLRQMAAAFPATTQPGSHVRLGILRLDQGSPTILGEVVEGLPNVDRDNLTLALAELERYPLSHDHLEYWWQVVGDDKAKLTERVNAMLALAMFVEDTPRWQANRQPFADLLLEHLTIYPNERHMIARHLNQTATNFFEPILEICQSQSKSTRGQLAREMLLEVWGDDVDRMTHVFTELDAEFIPPYVTRLDAFRNHEIKSRMDLLIDRFTQAGPGPLHSARLANVSAFLLRNRSFTDHLRLLGPQSFVGTRAQIIERAALLEAPSDYVLNLFDQAVDETTQASILLILGSLERQAFTQQSYDRTIALGREIFLQSNNAYLHSVAWWMLGQLDDDRNWVRQEIGRLATVQSRNSPADLGRTCDWTINSQGQTFIRFDWPGATVDVSATEVTREQFSAFSEQHPLPKDRSEFERRAPHQDCPTILISWFSAVDYCRWLTQEEGMGEEDQCYPPTKEEQETIGIYPNLRQRRGYRLLLPEEWTQACYGDATSQFAFGEDPSLLTAYGVAPGEYPDRFEIQTPVTQMKPLSTGMFGMYGGVREWCTGYSHGKEQQPIRGGSINDGVSDQIRLTRSGTDAKKINHYTVGFRICRTVDPAKP
ncbi:bifunctional serine/threonine-protein kinase/formylglycine-generating enzyme family protein [Roseiconus lacunae]|uniref:bifunctional serine/threonine-protein kinase/formylglycine-generating enzyme family protein n=1 Tax=Roseiconus lacunae TaxID=2605694 RepID=UPI0011F39A61|nr:bifunctional serine/threonine-protein kinase/formylglycine-generating enzyme family protein [Roseiconus lacunae]